MLKARKKSGIMMMDLITALAIFLVGFYAVFTLLYRQLGSIRNLYYRDIALMAAESELDMLRSLDFSELGDCSRIHLTGNSDMLTRLKDAKTSLDIRSYPVCDGKIKEVTVNIGWRHGRSGRGKIELTTLICEAGEEKK